MSETVLTAQGVSKTFRQGQESLTILHGIDLSVSAGEKIAIVGASGSGKTTLLQILGGLDEPDSGYVALKGTRLNVKQDYQISALRNRYLGFVYQLHHLLPELNAVDNVAMPLYIKGETRQRAHARSMHCLNLLGLAQRAKHTPAQLSGGERQRVAIARAMANHPACVLADEPTGNLDVENARHVMDLLTQACKQESVALIAITHDMTIAERMDHRYQLSYGKLERVTDGQV